jgi:hypothetical protein
MFEIIGYNEKGLIAVVDWSDRVVEWYDFKTLRVICDKYKIKIRGYINGMILCPSCASFDNDSADADYIILNPCKSLLDFLKANNFNYNPSKKLQLQARQQFFKGGNVEHLYIEQDFNYLDINNTFANIFYKDTKLDLFDFCIDLCSHYNVISALI